MKSAFGGFDCPQDKPNWEIISQTDFSISSAPCCQALDWTMGQSNGVFTVTEQFNEEYPVYETSYEGGSLFMWWMWHDNVGHWVINTTPARVRNFE